MLMKTRCVACAMLFSLLVTRAATAAQALDGLFQKVAPSTVLVEVKTKQGIRLGSGTLVDKLQFAVLTAASVVEDAESILVMFPEMEQGQVITTRHFYVSRAKDLAVPAKVFTIDARRDLAILNVQRIPTEVPAILLADASPRPGQSVFSIGHSSWSRGGVFGFASGHVRNVYQRRQDGVKVIESSIVTVQGDGGSPVFDEHGRLVGIVSLAATSVDSPDENCVEHFGWMDMSIDVTEIRDLLDATEIASEFQVPERAPTLDEMTQADLDGIIQELKKNFPDSNSQRLLSRALTEPGFNGGAKEIADVLGIESLPQPLPRSKDEGSYWTHLFADEKAVLELIAEQ